jgi:hypothetical protein
MAFEKISSKDAAALLKQAGAAIRTLHEKNQELKEKLATRNREDRVEKIAREMEEKGLSPELDLDEKVASLQKAQNLDVTEEAVKMAAPQGAHFDLSEEPGQGQHPFETYIVTGEDPR